MITRKEINLNTPLTEAQIEMLNTLAATPAVPDEDCPELTPEQLAEVLKSLQSGTPDMSQYMNEEENNDEI